MKKIIIVLAFIFDGLVPFATQGQSLTAAQIVKKADDKMRGNTSQGSLSMSVIRPEWTRNITMNVWSKGSDYSMVLITSPVKDKGQSYLKIKKEMWNWVPSINRMVKIPPSMMMQSWMNSDFTNDDLVRESSIVRDFKATLLGTEVVREKECHKIRLDALPEAAVVWGKIIVWITVEGYDQWKAEYYDEEGELVQTMNSSLIKKFGDRSIPSRIEIIPAGKKGQKTVLETISMSFNVAIDDAFFTQQNMKKLK